MQILGEDPNPPARGVNSTACLDGPPSGKCNVRIALAAECRARGQVSLTLWQLQQTAVDAEGRSAHIDQEEDRKCVGLQPSPSRH